MWTAIGPAPELGSQSGPVGAIAVDPSDSTGNTVYAAGASGGIWKTYDFLTTDPGGPNWIPLTDLGPLNSLNIGTLTTIPSKDGDPNKTTILAGTGTAVAASVTDDNSNITNSGVGFLRSIDGGRTWQVIDSSNNNVTVNSSTGVQTALPVSSNLAQSSVRRHRGQPNRGRSQPQSRDRELYYLRGHLGIHGGQFRLVPKSRFRFDVDASGIRPMHRRDPGTGNRR